MGDDFHKPALFGGPEFGAFPGGEDPAAVNRIAHETARALVARARESDDPAVVDRIVAYVDEHGVDAVAELWARASARSLPGALWNLSLIRIMIRQDPDGVALLFQRGTEILGTIDPVIAGAPDPAGPQEVLDLAEQILHGVFRGDLGTALDRAAAFCRVEAAGAASVADDQEPTSPERASELTRRAARLQTTAEDFDACARLARSDSLD